jgi:DNA-binding transcriptional LysR family regulator
MFKNVELRHIQHFVAVAEAGSFTRAATQVHIVQSGLSASIQALERELGVVLFHRTGRTIELTDAGTAFLPEARKVLVAVEVARDAVLDVQGGLRGTVRVGIMNAMALPQLSDVIAEFVQERPQVHFVPSLESGGSDEFIRAILHDRIDVAFTALPLDRYPDGITVIPLTTVDLLLAVPQAHRLAGSTTIQLEELNDETFIEYPPGWGLRQETDALFNSHGFARKITIEVGDIPTVLDLVARGCDAAFVIPSTVADNHALSLVQVVPGPRMHVSLAVRSSNPPRPATAAFIEAVQRNFIPTSPIS